MERKDEMRNKERSFQIKENNIKCPPDSYIQIKNFKSGGHLWKRYTKL